ncbi:protease modulator HflC [Thiobacter aerophilum]|uniref:Protein HflC n=1 Tax=Thiobacter aerophilum TaxID=3121275 RepID=A0ABV0EIK8_9BURK
MKPKAATVLVAALILLVIASFSLFTVDQRQNALVLQLGEIVSIKTQPGLYLKAPLVQNVIFVDRRVRTLDTPDSDLIITAEKINMLVDSFVKWRVADARQYYVSVRGDEKNAEARLLQLVRDGLRAEFNKRTVDDVVSGQREQVMESLRANVDREARALGIQVVDVRLKRVDYSEKVADSVYEQMRQERVRVANERRSTGAAEREKIQADADKQRQIIISEAYRDAQRIKGEGDAKAAAIYAQAYSLNPEFYAFYRSLDAYKESFKNRSDILVLDPNSEFFKYFKNPGRGGK